MVGIIKELTQTGYSRHVAIHICQLPCRYARQTKSSNPRSNKQLWRYICIVYPYFDIDFSSWEWVGIKEVLTQIGCSRTVFVHICQLPWALASVKFAVALATTSARLDFHQAYQWLWKPWRIYKLMSVPLWNFKDGGY